MVRFAGGRSKTLADPALKHWHGWERDRIIDATVAAAQCEAVRMRQRCLAA
jgi:hypothetical protein